VCGINRVPAAGRKIPEHMLRVADEALYKSKHAGRNRVTATMRADDPAYAPGLGAAESKPLARRMEEAVANPTAPRLLRTPPGARRWKPTSAAANRLILQIKKEFLVPMGTNTAYPQIAWSNSVDKSGFSSRIKCFEHWLFSAQFFASTAARDEVWRR
jgi:hypothetical protein